MPSSGSARHAPRPEDSEPFVPGDAVADVHAHSTRLGRRPRAARSSCARRTRPASGCSPSRTTTTSRPTGSSSRPARRRSPPDLKLIPAVEINAVTRGLDLELPEGELHVLGIGVDPADEAFEAALAAQRGARRPRFTTTVARLREIGMPIDAQLATPSTSTADDALGRPTRRPCARRRRVTPRASRTRSGGSSRHGQPGYVPRTGLGPVEAIHAIRAAGGLASLAHFWQAPDRISLLRDLIAEGLDGLETHHRSFDPDRPRRRSARRRGRSASSRPGARTTTATRASTRRPTPAW